LSLEEAEALLRRLGAPLSRGELKRIAASLDGAIELRRSLIAKARAADPDLPEEALAWSGKQLIRRLRAREAEAQVISTPIARDDPFRCARCGLQVLPNGRSPRDHCPGCLWSRHVDVVPGDRASDCGGALRPVGAAQSAGRWTILYRCEACGQERRNRATLGGTQPDSWEALVRVAAQGVAGGP
jgi:DNA-directed RNA polymerase subunit RPC12/RpoP